MMESDHKKETKGPKKQRIANEARFSFGFVAELH